MADSRVSLVTGSARGIGLAVARYLRTRGDRVHVVFRTENDRAALLRDEFGQRTHRADLLAPADAQRLAAEVLALDGRIDHAIHAVGEYVSGPLFDLDHADFRRMWQSNAESAFLFFNAVRAALRSTGGRTVFFGCSGLNGLRGRRETAAYAAAKSALLVLVRGWAIEEAAHGVTVNLISPGVIPHDGAHADTLDTARQARIPLGEPGRLDDVAEAVSWLCSPAARHTTGTDLLVSGGWML